MDAKKMSLYARGYWFLGRNILAGKIINKFLDLLAFLDYRMLILLSMWHPDMETRIRYLRKRGVHVGEHVHIDFGLMIEFTTPQSVYIEDYVAIAYGAQIFAHDAAPGDLVDLPMKVTETRIGYNSAIGGYSVIMAGVTVGKTSGVVAGSTVTKDVPDGKIVGGNPAKVLFGVDDLILGWEAAMKANPELFYDHDNENRAPSTPFDDLITWRKEGLTFQPDSLLRTGTPFDYILEAKNMDKRRKR